MRYMTILFIPAAMGIMDNYSLLLANWIPIIFASVGGSIIVLYLTAYLTEHLHKPVAKASDNKEKQS